jgi:quinol-cytochrome oxidoreductase complex cytochrome b subunit/nitrite reductase/ring-hydroxylating ferredoxin subunit
MSETAEQGFWSKLGFNDLLIGAVTLLILTLIGLILALYVLPREHLEIPELLQGVRVARAADFPVGASRVASWGERTILVVRSGENRFVGLEGTSPRDGCLLRWDVESLRIVSPCSYAVFDLQGNVVTGLTTTPLQRRAWRSGASWVANLWSDIRASTDSSLLGVARFVGLLYGPIDRSLRIDEALRKALKYRLAAHAGWRHMFGGITYLLFMILVVTGVLLAFYYRPSIDEAYPSIQHLTSEVSFGWLIRDLHVWSANLIVIAVLAHMGRVFFSAAYKPPRETGWLIGLMLLFVVLAFGATGYLLPWDQWAYWTTTEVLDAASATVIVGGVITEAIMGDAIVSGATLSRFFAVHVIVLPWFAFALLGYHFTLVRRRGVAPPVETQETTDPWRASAAWSAKDLEELRPGTPFFPDHLLRMFVVAVLVLAVAVSLAALFPRPLADVADPYVPPSELVSTLSGSMGVCCIHTLGTEPGPHSSVRQEARAPPSTQTRGGRGRHYVLPGIHLGLDSWPSGPNRTGLSGLAHRRGHSACR